MAHDPPPIPARFRWLKRCTLAALVLMTLLLGLRAYWGHVWHSRFQAELQAIRDRGEPIDLADFNPPPVDDADNGAVWLRKAMAAWPNVPGSSQSILDTDWYMDPDQHADPITDNAAYLAALGPALDLIDRAAQAPTSHWETGPFVSPIIANYNVPHLTELRRLARLMSEAGVRSVDEGEIDDALFLAERIYGLSASLHDPPVSLLDRIVAISIRAVAIGWIEDQLPRVESLDRGENVRKRMLSLIESLAEKSSGRQVLHDAMVFERMYTQDTVQGLADGRVPFHMISYGMTPNSWDELQRRLLKPLYYRDGCIMLDYYTRSIDEAGRDESYDFVTIDTEFDVMEDRPLRHPIVTAFSFTLSLSERTRVQQLIRQRLARTALALKLYELEQGRIAQTLDELVPDYLDEVPVDTMDPAGGPLRYLPNGGEVTLPDYHWLTAEQVAEVESRRLPLIYSVGRNGVDDGGMVLLNSDGTPDDTSRYNHRDFDEPTDHWFLLAPMPEPIPDPNPNAGYPGFGYPGGGYPGGYPGSGYGSP